MGASLWSYVVDDDDVQVAFRELRAELGDAPSPEDDACRSGTHSLLDMRRVVETPAPPDAGMAFDTDSNGMVVISEADIAGLMEREGSVFQMSADELMACVGTPTPSRADVEAATSATSMDFRFIERGTGRYARLFHDGRPIALWFVGISGD